MESEPEMQRILGIDPGSLSTGYSVIESDGRVCRHIHSGHIQLSKLSATERLAGIFDGINEIIKVYAPEVMVVENVFMAKNASAALKLGQARGVAICAGVKAGLPVQEYSARFIKKTITGNGAANKQQVKYMVCHLLGVAERSHDDESDALAIALCYVFAKPSEKLQE